MTETAKLIADERSDYRVQIKEGNQQKFAGSSQIFMTNDQYEFSLFGVLRKPHTVHLGHCANFKITLKLVFVYALVKIQTVFTPSCFLGKHLLSYYQDDANVTDVWGSIYMTIPSAPERLYAFVVTVFPTGTPVPFPKCFLLHTGTREAMQLRISVMRDCSLELHPVVYFDERNNLKNTFQA